MMAPARDDGGTADNANVPWLLRTALDALDREENHLAAAYVSMALGLIEPDSVPHADPA